MNLKQLVEDEMRAPIQAPRPEEGLSNEAYQRLCKERLDEEVQQIAKRYEDSASEAWKYLVR